MELSQIINEIRSNLVVPLWPHAGKALGLSRGSTYAAAERGQIPTIRIGRVLRVPTRSLEQMLDRATEPTCTSAGNFGSNAINNQKLLRRDETKI
jgi:hypothetical protein